MSYKSPESGMGLKYYFLSSEMTGKIAVGAKCSMETFALPTITLK
jgi:hypothetical protein